MQISIITASHRPLSQSLKIANYLDQNLKQINSEIVTNVIDLQAFNLPFFNFEALKNSQILETWNSIEKKLTESDGFIFVSPEYGGMATPILKNFFLYCSSKAKPLAHKSALLVGVSSARGGAFVISDLRSSSYKNTFVNYIPDQLIIRECESILNDNILNPENKTDYYIKQRVDYTLKILLEYAKISKQILDLGLIDLQTYGNGMG